MVKFYMISIVCVYNNAEILDKFLLKSLKNQSAEYELILMDNTQEKFKSAAEALNYGGANAKNKYLMFVHQDVDLSSEHWLEETEKILNSLEKLGISGVAGKIKHKDAIITNIEDGIPPKKISSCIIDSPVKAQTLDECLFIIPKSIFETLKFDEQTCDDWHLYAADYALTVHQMGLNAYVMPSYLYHRSRGYSYSESFDSTLRKLLIKHWKEAVIYTTVGDWITFYPLNIQKRWPDLKERTKSILKKLRM